MLLIVLASVFYPLVEPGWMEPGDFRKEICDVPPVPYSIPSLKLHEQQSYYTTTADPAIREKILRTLHEARNPETPTVLAQLLKKETDPSLQADILALMYETAIQDRTKQLPPVSFKKYLNHPVALARAKAAELLLLSKSGVKEILNMLEKEQTASVPAAVFEALLASGVVLNPADLEKLTKSGNSAVRAGALKTLAARDEKADQNETLLTVLKGADPVAQLAVAQGVARDPNHTEGLAEKLLKHKDARIRFCLAQSLPVTKNRIALLKELLSDASPLVRAEAAATLMKAADSDSFMDELAGLLHDPDRQVRLNAGTAIAHFISQDELPKNIISSVSDSKAHEPLIQILYANGNVKHAAVAGQVFTAAQKDGATAVQVMAIRTLAKMKAVRQVSLILSSVDSKVPEIRKTTAEALRFFPGSATTEALRRLMFDEDGNTGIAAMNSIYYLKDPEFVPSLARAIGSVGYSPVYRAVACRTCCATPAALNKQVADACSKLLLKACIPVPMSEPTYDAGFARGCALMTLFKAGQTGNAVCQKAFEDAIQHLDHPTKKEQESSFTDEFLTEYIRQIKLSRDGKDVTPQALSISEPEYPIQRIRNEKNN